MVRTTNADYAVNLSEFETEPCNQRQARENMQRMPSVGKCTLVLVFGLLLIG